MDLRYVEVPVAFRLYLWRGGGAVRQPSSHPTRRVPAFISFYASSPDHESDLEPEPSKRLPCGVRVKCFSLGRGAVPAPDLGV
jgi:hypothetical protein